MRKFSNSFLFCLQMIQDRPGWQWRNAQPSHACQGLVTRNPHQRKSSTTPTRKSDPSRYSARNSRLSFPPGEFVMGVGQNWEDEPSASFLQVLLKPLAICIILSSAAAISGRCNKSVILSSYVWGNVGSEGRYGEGNWSGRDYQEKFITQGGHDVSDPRIIHANIQS